MIDKEQVAYLRTLATRVSQIAKDPIQQQRVEKWRLHNSLKSTEPLLLIYPEGSFDELIRPESLRCSDPDVRRLEYTLLRRIYYAEHLQDDNPIPDEIVVTKHLAPFDWGIEEKRKDSSEQKGAFDIVPSIHSMEDVERLRIPEIIYDRERTLSQYQLYGDLVGDILPVRIKGQQFVSFHLTAWYIYHRGLENMLLDMYLQPEMITSVMEFLVKAYTHMMDEYERKHLISYNCDHTYHSSGGNGYLSDELTGDTLPQSPEVTWPKPEREETDVRLSRMWGSAEAQELASVSPEHHRQFAMEYEKQLLSRFALTGYGCCEDLTDKLEDVFSQFPNMRRISISPWADVERCAEIMKGRAIYSWKPNPAYLVGPFDPEVIRLYVRKTLKKTQEEGNYLEIVLKDTHTVEDHPERFEIFRQVVREEIARL